MFHRYETVEHHHKFQNVPLNQTAENQVKATCPSIWTPHALNNRLKEIMYQCDCPDEGTRLVNHARIHIRP